MTARTMEVAGRIVGGAAHLLAASILALIAALALHVYGPALAQIWSHGIGVLTAALGG